MEKWSRMIRTKVHLHGLFSKFYDGPIEVVAKTAAEAVEAVARQVKGFRPDTITGRKRAVVVGFERVEDLFRPLTEDDRDIHLIPQLNGGKEGGFMQILLGGLFIAASFIPGIGQSLQMALLLNGAIMVLGGLIQLLMPQPEADTRTDNRSRYLGAPGHTSRIGTRIPILYGKRKVFGHYLGFDIDAKEV